MSTFKDIDPFRKPDFQSEIDSPFSARAVWFGKEGPEGEHATELTRDPSGYIVAEYVFLLPHLDEPTADDHEYPFRKISTYVEDREILALTDGSAEDVSDLPVEDVIRAVARVGVERIAEKGGTEEMVDSLPDVSDLEQCFQESSSPSP